MSGLADWWTTWYLEADHRCTTMRGYPGTWPFLFLYQWHGGGDGLHSHQVCRWLKAPLNMFEDRAAIQRGLDNLEERANSTFTRFSKEKCQVLLLENNSPSQWQAGSAWLESSSAGKALRALVGSKLSVSQQCPCQQWGPITSWAIPTGAWPVDGWKGIPLFACTYHI